MHKDACLPRYQWILPKSARREIRQVARTWQLSPADRRAVAKGFVQDAFVTNGNMEVEDELAVGGEEDDDPSLPASCFNSSSNFSDWVR